VHDARLPAACADVLCLPACVVAAVAPLSTSAGARSIDLAPSAQCGDQAALPEVVIVFVQVLGGSTFSYKRHRSETHALRKAITRCMLNMLDDLPETEEGRDGYLCRCQEADLKYMVSFKTAHMALQWCMLVQVRAAAAAAVLLWGCWVQSRLLPFRTIYAQQHVWVQHAQVSSLLFCMRPFRLFLLLARTAFCCACADSLCVSSWLSRAVLTCTYRRR
jgi:hypothetical protein